MLFAFVSFGLKWGGEMGRRCVAGEAAARRRGEPRLEDGALTAQCCELRGHGASLVLRAGAETPFGGAFYAQAQSYLSWLIQLKKKHASIQDLQLSCASGALFLGNAVHTWN